MHASEAEEAKELQSYSGGCGNVNDCSASFTHPPVAFTKRKALTVHRILQIGAAAALGGSVMCVASQVTAPAVAAAMSGLLNASPTLLEFMTSASLLLDSLGIGASGILGIVSAGLASWKMSKRTERLKEFYIESLHIPTLKDTSINDLIELKQNDHAKLGLPIYLLATGHCEKGVDFRFVWGAEGLVESTEEEGTSTYFSWFSRLFPQGEPYLLHWDRQVSDNLADAYNNFIWDRGMSIIIDELLKVSTVGKLLNVAHWDITILEKASELDNPCKYS